MLKFDYKILLISSLLLISACSSTPTVGEKMMSQGSETQKLGKNWVVGNELIVKGTKEIGKGESSIKDGEKLIKKGKAQIQEVKSLIKKGKKIEKKTENAFQEKFPEIPLD
jgi:hypothetical protein